MAKKDFEKLSESILDLVGGKENVNFLTNCYTRLRFNLKDKNIVDIKELEKVDGVLGTQWSGDQLQVIIGQDVSKVAEVMHPKLGDLLGDIKGQNEDNSSNKKKMTPGSIFNAICDTISGCILPIIPILVAAGMINVIIIFLGKGGILAEDSSTYLILKAVADAGFYFFPIFIGGFAAKKLKANESLGMLMGAILVAPSIVAAFGEGISLTFLGIPVLATTYSSTVLPVILIVYVMSFVEKTIKKYCPEMLASIVVPLLTVLIMIPLALCALGPVASYAGQYIAEGLMWLYNTTGFFGVAVIGGLFPVLIITGMHTALLPFVLQSLATVGYEPFMSALLFLHNFTQGAAAFAVGIIAKDKKIKSLAIGSSVQCFLATISEPALYGITFKYRKPLIAAMIGNFVGGAIFGLFQVHLYQFGGTGIFSIANFIGPTMQSLVGLLIGVAVASVVTFVLTFVFMRNHEITEVAEIQEV